MKILFLFVFCLAISLAMPPVEQMPMRQAVDQWNLWNRMDGFRPISIGYTGSMKPHIKGGEFILLENAFAYQFTSLKGELINVARWDKPCGVLHIVIDETPTRVLTQGTNCMWSDGWQDRNRIKEIARRIIRIKND